VITLRWAPFPGADVASYNVYRSILGFEAPLPDPTALRGKTLIFRTNETSAQTITFDSGSAVDKINSTIKGARAYTSLADSTRFLLRNDVRSAPGSFQIIGGTALSLLGLTSKTIYERSDDTCISHVPASADPQGSIEFEDGDGVCQDWYTVTSVDHSGNDSAKAPYRQPTSFTGPVCVLEGIVTNLQGARMPDIEVIAKLVRYPQEIHKCPQVTLEPISVRTGSDGRFSIPLLQDTLVQIEIEAVGFSRDVTVPKKAYEFLTDLQVDLDYRYPLEYRQ